VFFDHLQIHQRLNGRQVLERQRAMASRFTAEDRANYVGLEISYGPHVAAYGAGLEPPDYEKALNGLTMKDAVSFVHAQQGIASLCHPLSARPGSLAALVFGKDLPPTPLDRVDRIAQKLLAEDVYEADMIEVAYEEEALPASLRLWDRLSAAGYAVTGVGVSNSHSMHEGWEDGFVTWVYAETRSEADLLDALKRGRACFGRAGLFSGKLDLSTPAGQRMGSMALVQSDSQVVNVLMEDAPANSCIVVIVNGEPAGTLSGGEGRVVREVNVDTRANAFVRVVVETGDGIPIAFSNPIYFVRTAPKHGLPPHRALKLALKLK
jgi:hypothetical protein